VNSSWPALSLETSELDVNESPKRRASVLNLRVALKSNRWAECWDRLNDSDYLKVKLAAWPQVTLRSYTPQFQSKDAMAPACRNE
jgi:hypothetical protein